MSDLNEKGYIGNFKGTELNTFPFPKDNEVVVFSFDEEIIDVEIAYQFFEKIKELFPDNMVIGLPKNSEIEIRNIDKLIKDLEKLKDEHILYRRELSEKRLLNQ